MSSATQLSTNDRAVLGALFDPEASLARSTDTKEDFPKPQSRAVPASIILAEQQAVKLLNVLEPSQQDVETAIAQLTSIIASCPTYASAYANRAQAYRLVTNADINAPVLGDVLNDLDKAISLATPVSPTIYLSERDARVLASAHTHRGYLFLKASTLDIFREILTSVDASLLQGAPTPARLEELASRDFGIAGRYGNKTAQQLAVKTNPYAKLCGQIVKEALQREMLEYYEGTGVGA